MISTNCVKKLSASPQINHDLDFLDSLATRKISDSQDEQ
jgi:hypothetical protein